MNRFINVLKNSDDLDTLKGASADQITEAEIQLNVFFSDEYREYLEMFGIASANGHEFYLAGCAGLPCGTDLPDHSGRKRFRGGDASDDILDRVPRRSGGEFCRQEHPASHLTILSAVPHDGKRRDERPVDLSPEGSRGRKTGVCLYRKLLRRSLYINI